MARLGYLLPFLCALGIRASSTINPTTPKTVAPSSSPLTITQVATTMNKISTVTQPKSAVPITAAATPAATTHATTVVPQTSVGTTKPSTTAAISGSQGATQPITVKAATTTVRATSSTSTPVGTTKNNIPTAVSPNVSPTQPTNPPKASTPVLKSSTIEGISQSNVTESATQPIATSQSFTSVQTFDKNVTNYSSTVASSFGVSPSTVTLSKTTAGIISDSTIGLITEAIPKMIPSEKYSQENIEVSCNKEHGGSLVKINIKSSRICESISLVNGALWSPVDMSDI